MRPLHAQGMQPMLLPQTGCASRVRRIVRQGSIWSFRVPGIGTQCAETTNQKQITLLKCNRGWNEKAPRYRKSAFQTHRSSSKFSCAGEMNKVKKQVLPPPLLHSPIRFLSLYLHDVLLHSCIYSNKSSFPHCIHDVLLHSCIYSNKSSFPHCIHDVWLHNTNINHAYSNKSSNKNQKVQNSFHSPRVYTTGCEAAALCNTKHCKRAV